MNDSTAHGIFSVGSAFLSQFQIQFNSFYLSHNAHVIQIYLTFSHKTVSGMYKFVYGKLSHLFVKLTHSTVDHNLSNE